MKIPALAILLAAACVTPVNANQAASAGNIFFGLTIVDNLQTKSGLDRGCVEGNPPMKFIEHGSRFEYVAEDAAITAVLRIAFSHVPKIIHLFSAGEVVTIAHNAATLPYCPN